jgi:hypothetical protein
MIRDIGLMGGRQARPGRPAEARVRFAVGGQADRPDELERTRETHSTNHYHININSLSHQATRIGNRIIRSFSLDPTQ